MITLSSSGWKIEAIDTVLFDKDGTLIDSHLYWGRIIEKRSHALIAMLNLKEEVYPLLCRQMGFSLDTNRLLPQGPIALVSRERVIDILMEFFAEEDIPVTFRQVDRLFIEVHSDFMKEMRSYIKILPHVKSFLKGLKEKNIKTAVITTDSIKNTEEIMVYLGIHGYFDLLLGKESTPLPKVTGEPAFIALERLKAEPVNAIAIGDSAMDITMAKKASLKAGVGVALGQVTFEELSRETEYVVRGYDELCISK